MNERQPGHPVAAAGSPIAQHRTARAGSRQQPPVDHQGGPGDVAAGVGGEEQRSGPAGSSTSAQRPRESTWATRARLSLKGPTTCRRVSFGPDPAGSQAVDPHPVGGRLDGRGAVRAITPALAAP